MFGVHKQYQCVICISEKIPIADHRDFRGTACPGTPGGNVETKSGACARCSGGSQLVASGVCQSLSHSYQVKGTWPLATPIHLSIEDPIEPPTHLSLLTQSAVEVNHPIWDVTGASGLQE